MERITSRQNAVVKRFRALARTAPASGGEILLDGEHLIDEALQSGIPIEIAAVSTEDGNGARGSPAKIVADVRSAGGRVFHVTKDVLNAISPVRQPSGVVAIARIQTADLGSAFQTAGRPPLVLVLADVQDPGNVGAVIRSAAAFGATAVIATDGSANPFGWKALRGAMGGTFRLPVVASAGLADVVDAARAAEVPLVATVPRGGTPLPEARLGRGCAIVLGGEGSGLPEQAIAAARDRVTIPMRAPVESLNVATAAAIVLYEASRQRTERE